MRRQSAVEIAVVGTRRGAAFNVGTDEQNYRVRELAEILAGVAGCEIEIAEGSSADHRSYRVSFPRDACRTQAARQNVIGLLH